jgi:hypothetical protein
VGPKLETIAPGMVVKTIDNRQIGRVVQRNSCCLQFQKGPGTRIMYFSIDGVLDVRRGQIALVCLETETHRYSCSSHAPAVPFEASVDDASNAS